MDASKSKNVLINSDKLKRLLTNLYLVAGIRPISMTKTPSIFRFSAITRTFAA